MEYIEAPKDEKSPAKPFSEIPKTKDDKSVYILWRGPKTYIVLNRYPYNAGHLLVLPYREVADLEDLHEDEMQEMMKSIILAKKILREALSPDGFNVGFNLGEAAGAGIPKHLHCHIVPRWSGDTNFMPVLGKTRVLPISLEAMWERLRKFA